MITQKIVYKCDYCDAFIETEQSIDSIQNHLALPVIPSDWYYVFSANLLVCPNHKVVVIRDVRSNE